MNVKAGDYVLFTSKWDEGSIYIVDHVTKTGRIVACPKNNVDIKVTFRENGQEIVPNGVYYGGSIRPLTSEDIEEIKNKQYIGKTLYRIKKIEKLTVEQAKAINDLLDTIMTDD